jgi:hypothetical protein
MTATEAASDLYDHLCGSVYPDWLSCIGVGVDEAGNRVIVICLNYKPSGDPIPAMWRGFHVKQRVTGRMRLL